MALVPSPEHRHNINFLCASRYLIILDPRVCEIFDGEIIFS